MIYYYSGCGNSRFVAETLAADLGEDLKFIPDLVDEGIGEYGCDAQMLGFVFPVYAWDVPKLVKEFVLKARWKGTPSYVWFACTCGDNIGMTDRTFRRTLASVGLKFDAVFTFQMPETYLCFPGFNLDTPENAKLKNDAVRKKLPDVARQIKERKQVVDLIPGGWPRTKTYLIGPLFNLVVSDSGFYAKDSCIGCGACAKVCSRHNILMKDGKPYWNGDCTQCMACYHYCPVNAIHYGKLTEGKGQYHF